MKNITFQLSDGTVLAHTGDDETPNLGETVSLETVSGTEKTFVSYKVDKIIRNFVHNSEYVDPLYVEGSSVTVTVSTPV